MSGQLVGIVARAPLMWAAWYTLGLPPALRRARRAEIASDTAEHVADPDLAGRPLYLACDVLQSLLCGVPDDLRWRAGHVSVGWRVALPGAIAAAPSCLIGWLFAHINGPLPGAAAGILALLLITTALLALSYSEVAMDTHKAQAGAPRAGSLMTALPALAVPITMFAALLILPFASWDPLAEDHYKEALIAGRAAETGRWITGSIVYGVALALAAVAVAGAGARLRIAGSTLAGAAGPLLFALGATAVAAGDVGGTGIGLAGVMDTGGDGVAYLKGAGEAGLALAFFGWVACGVALIMTGVGAWRTRLVAAAAGRLMAGAFIAQGAISLLPISHIHGGTSIIFLQPLVGLASFGILGAGLLSDPRGVRDAPAPAGVAREVRA
jgi:hypothetical protein